jgi:ketosteroid isomerase-like protein
LSRTERIFGLHLKPAPGLPRLARYWRTMSDRDEEMIARLRRFYEAFNRDDFDTAMEIAHPEIEFVRPWGQPPLRGAEALRAWMQPDAFEEQRLEALEFRIKGNTVLVRSHASGRGAGSGIDVDVDFWAVWTLNDDGLATRLAFYLDHQEDDALEAAGLEE